MPDAHGNVKGQGWSRKREEGWDRVFGTEMRAHDHDWPEPLDELLRRWPVMRDVLPCEHATLKHESHSQIRYCANCGADVD